MPLLDHLRYRFDDTADCVDRENETLKTIASRGSCRDFENRSVDRRLTNTLAAVALCSPTKSDLQQRDIIVIEDAARKEAILSLYPQDEWFQHAPTLLVFCGNNRRQRQIALLRDKPFANDHLDAFFNASVDAGIALSAFVIAAESEGLGCCPISAIRNHAQIISEILELPDHVFPVAGLAIGWPAKSPAVSMRLPLQATVHTDRFSDEGIEQTIEQYDRRRETSQPYANQRSVKRFGELDQYGWSEDKARQYAEVERADFGDFIQRKKFSLE